jgi:hypothetical protein
LCLPRATSSYCYTEEWIIPNNRTRTQVLRLPIVWYYNWAIGGYPTAWQYVTYKLHHLFCDTNMMSRYQTITCDSLITAVTNNLNQLDLTCKSSYNITS